MSPADLANMDNMDPRKLTPQQLRGIQNMLPPGALNVCNEIFFVVIINGLFFFFF
jgi:hypothetical protein